MNIENFSNIEAQILIRSSLNATINFSTLNSSSYNNQILTSRKNRVTFAPDYQVIPSGKKAEILVTLSCVNEEKIDHILELMIQNGESQFVKLRANIQEPKVCLNRYSVNLGKIYAGIQESV